MTIHKDDRTCATKEDDISVDEIDSIEEPYKPETKDQDEKASARTTTRARVLRCALKTLASIAVITTILLLILLFGTWHEHRQIKQVQASLNMLDFFQTDEVCVINVELTSNATEPDPSSSSNLPAFLMIETVGNAQEIQNTTNTTNSTIVAHCGDCGQCSNPHDINIYDDTSTTLYKDSTACAKKGIFGGRAAVEHCMDDRVGFTQGCNDCWVDNIMCDLQKCVFSCFFHAIFSGQGFISHQKSETLNRCTLCDEVRCGPAFIQCAGANRRRTGILSDIQRDEAIEVCQKVNPTRWWKEEKIQEIWNQQQQAETNAQTTREVQPSFSKMLRRR